MPLSPLGKPSPSEPHDAHHGVRGIDVVRTRRRVEMVGLSLVVLLMSLVTIAVMASEPSGRTAGEEPAWVLQTSCFQVLSLLCGGILLTHASDRGLRAWERVAGRAMGMVPVGLLVVAAVHDLL
jgi:hypothetical protein